MEIEESPKPQKISKEKLNRWLEAAFDEKAVGVSGVSVESLRKILATGEIPPSRSTNLVPRLQRLTEGRPYLYYAFPFLQRIKKLRPELAESLEASLPERTLRQFVEEFSDESIMYGARHYAIDHALSDCFREQTGIYIDSSNLLAIGSELVPEKIRSFRVPPYIYGAYDVWEEYKDDEEIARIKTQFTDDQLAKIISTCMDRRGVLLYYNSGIFSYGVLQGYEDEKEIIIACKEPMDISVISGVEVLSEADKAALE